MFEIEQPYFNDSTDDRITTQSTNLYMAINKDYEKQHTQQLYHSCLQWVIYAWTATAMRHNKSM